MSPYISAFENLPNDEDRPATLAYSERAWGLAPRPNIGPCQRCSGIHPVPSTSIASSHLPANSQHPLFSKSADILKSTAADLHHSRYITVYVQILPSFVLFVNNCFKIKSKCILLHDGMQGSSSFWHISIPLLYVAISVTFYPFHTKQNPQLDQQSRSTHFAANYWKPQFLCFVWTFNCFCSPAWIFSKRRKWRWEPIISRIQDTWSQHIVLSTLPKCPLGSLFFKLPTLCLVCAADGKSAHLKGGQRGRLWVLHKGLTI